ncbi:peptidoglycan-binding protein [Clostridium thermobutyricum]|uniref:peptidoglycan-binding protein n=1 Tax=Clostridium thermobutyricum TaxID=29372 RepID=UPI002942A636|nr:peptidoglycan-binding protein [Clostridium thermobutyricum]
MLLENGSTGSDVTCLEYDLHILNCYTGGFDGDFGPGLEAAVKQFQGRSGLEQDGIVGDGTWGKICEDIKTIQFALDAFGYELQTDGLGGPNTLEAVKVFQESKGLTADGYVGPATESALGISLYNGNSGSGSTASGNDNFPLKVGSAGPYVKCLEYGLHIANCYPSNSYDGIFGPQVEAAVRQFQTRAGIGVDGIVGPQTWGALKGVISNIQNALNRHGFNLSVDGEGGPATLNAVESFQSSHGLGVDGYVGPQTASALGIQYFGRNNSGSEGEGGQPTSTIVKYVQKVLNFVYGYNLTEDGIVGPNTTSAIKNLQASYNIEQDGIIGPMTIDAVSKAQADFLRGQGLQGMDLFMGLARLQVQFDFKEYEGDNRTPYNYWYYGSDTVAEWCAIFVSWCANFSGEIASGEIPKYASCGNGVDWYKSVGRFRDNSYTPNTGDIIFFYEGFWCHTCIVEYVDGNEIHTIEGNCANQVLRQVHQLGASNIGGFGVNYGYTGKIYSGNGSHPGNDGGSESTSQEIIAGLTGILGIEYEQNLFSGVTLVSGPPINIEMSVAEGVNIIESKSNVEFKITESGLSANVLGNGISFTQSIIDRGIATFTENPKLKAFTFRLFSAGCTSLYAQLNNPNEVIFKFKIKAGGTIVTCTITVTVENSKLEESMQLSCFEGYFVGLQESVVGGHLDASYSESFGRTSAGDIIFFGTVILIATAPEELIAIVLQLIGRYTLTVQTT